ncbi:MAG: hypothetical protein QXM75_04050, partial [Candidatus Diapherotrites archaeon]
SLINSMKSELEELRKAEIEAVSFELDFLNSPVAGNERKLKEKMILCFDLLELIENLKKEYENVLTLLRLDIANAQDLTIDEKKSLQKASEIPEEMTKIDIWYISATSMHFSENMENMYNTAVQNALIFADGIHMRIKRDESYRLMFEENETIRKETNNEFLTLKQAYETITKEEYYDKWINQSELTMLKSNWARAQSALQKEDYDSAILYAKKAMENALRVYKDGWVKPSDDQKEEIAYKAIIALFIILAIVVIFRYAKRKGLFYTKGEEYEEVNIK